MTSPDITNTLLKLRGIASPTVQYQADLLALLQSMPATDLAHVAMLLQAGYFQFSTFEQMQEELKTLRANPQTAQLDRIHELETNVILAQSLAGSFSSIANVGFTKVTDFSWDEAVSTLALVYPTGASTAAFQKALTTLGTLTNEQKHFFMLLASDKNEGEPASRLALDLFQTTTDETPSALGLLVEKLKWGARDLTLAGGISQFRSLSHEEVVGFVKQAYQQRGAVALQAFLKSTDKSHANVLAIAALLGTSARETFIVSAIDAYESVSTAQTKELCQTVPAVCAAIAQKVSSKWSDPSVDNAAEVADLLTYDNKDLWLQNVLGYFTSLSTDEVLALEEAAYEKQYAIALALLAKISDLSVPNIARICNTFSYAKKDEWLFAVEPRISGVTTAELLQLMAAAYEKNYSFAEKVLPKISDLNVANANTVADVFHYGNKDKWLVKATATLPTMSTAELISILNSAYEANLELAKINASKISDLTPTNGAKVAETFNYGQRDAWLAAVESRWTALTTADLLLVIKAAYEKQLALSTTLLPRVTDLTVAHALTIAREFHYGNIDRFLLAAVDLVTDLTPTTLDNLANAAYDQKEQIRAKGNARLGR